MMRRKVGVVMGGPSSEHGISLKSGKGVVEALTKRGWPVEAVVIPQELDLAQACDDAKRRLTKQGIEVAFIALHGPFGEDGTIQRVCEELRMPYTGSGPEASAIGLDKVASRERFERGGLTVPRWRFVSPTDTDAIERAIAVLGFPVVVKPTNQGSSFGISVAAHHAELLGGIERAARYDSRLLLEAFVRGRELTVGVLGDEALPVVEIKPHAGFFDYTSKYTPGQTDYIAPAPLPADVARAVQRAGLRAHQLAGCRHFSRVDVLLNASQEPVILEVNTIPGLTATSLLPKAAACVGITYDELCERIVQMALPAGPKPAVRSALRA